MNELRALTGARGIAAWLVVFFHIRGAVAGLPRGVEAALAKGYLAVDFFFLLSGFVIWLAWHARLRDERTVALFLQRRVARIWPLHLAALAAAVALAALLAATGRAEPAAFPPAELPLHLLLLQNWGFTAALAWNDPAWSISAELAAYLLFPLLAIAVDWRRVPSPALLAIGAAMLLALHWSMNGAPTLGTDIARLGLRRCLGEFGTGTIVAALWLRHRPASPLPPLLLAAALAAAWATGAPETLAVPAAFAALLLALARSAGRRGHPLEAAIPHYLGEISYATYLGHFILWKVFKLAVVRDAAAVPPVQVAAYLLLVLAASVALYHGLERPAQRRINALRLPRRFRPAPLRVPPPTLR